MAFLLQAAFADINIHKADLYITGQGSLIATAANVLLSRVL